LRRPVDSLYPKVLLVVPKLPIICPAPREHSDPVHAILPQGLQPLVQVRLVVQTPRAVELLVGLLLIIFAEDGEPKFCDSDGGTERIPQIVKVRAEVGGRDVNVRLGGVADVPAGGGGGGLRDAVGT
jgi:hypothetical protein